MTNRSKELNSLYNEIRYKAVEISNIVKQVKALNTGFSKEDILSLMIPLNNQFEQPKEAPKINPVKEAYIESNYKNYTYKIV